MKKTAFIIATALSLVILASCSGGASKKEAILDKVDDFFAQHEQVLATIDNAEDFIAFSAELEDDRSAFAQSLYDEFPSYDNGNFKDFSDKENEEIQGAIYDRATQFNEKAAAKCAEFLAPLIDRLGEAVDAAKAEHEAKGQVSDEATNRVIEAFDEVFAFADYDNIPIDLQERFDSIASTWEDMVPETELGFEDDEM